MLHINFALYVLALCAGAISIAVSLLFYVQFHRKVILCYALMLLSVSLVMISRMVGVYQQVAGLEGVAALGPLAAIIERIAFAVAVFSGPHFCHHLVGIPMTKTNRIAYAAAGAAYIVAASVELTLGSMPGARAVRLGIAGAIMFGLYVYLVIKGGLRLGKLGSRLLNRVLIGTLAISLIVFPAALYQYITQRPYLPNYMENPLSFLLLNLFCILFAFKYFDQPAFLEGDHVSDHFKKRFSISDREAEIVGALVKGSSNAEIADKLFISVRTVESHLYSIFQKTGVKNRVQLVNLIQTNRTG